MRVTKQWSARLLAVAVLCTLAATSWAKGTTEPPKDKEPLLEYSVLLGFASNAPYTEKNPNDVVTPFVEDKFNIRVKEIIQSTAAIQPRERLNMLIAANNVPDAMVSGGEMLAYAVSTGQFADLTDYIAKMSNLNRLFPKDQWYIYENDGRRYQIPHLAPLATDTRYNSDPFFGGFVHALWVREDILKKLGYKFTPLKGIATQYMDQGKKAPLSAYDITPAIDSPEKFMKLLKEIKALNLKVGDRDVIPFSSTWWSSCHVGCMFDYGHWRRDSDGNVSGFLGTPEAKEWMRMLWTMYQEKLIDPSYVLQKDDQLQQKIASGQVAAGMQIPDLNGAVNSLARIDPSYTIRFIPLPKRQKDRGFFDITVPGFYRWVIRKGFPDIKRLTQYFDWFFSDEAIDLLTWGPKSAGLYSVSGGVKQFIDPRLAKSLVSGTAEGSIGPEYYGLWAPLAKAGGLGSYTARVAQTVPHMGSFNPFDSRKSYPVKLDMYLANRAVGLNGYDSAGIASYGDGGENTAAVGSYFWGTFQNDRIGRILSSANEAEFEANWREQYNLFVKEGKYLEAKADMERWFKKYGP
jgi:putative aldouronate transport system substrate-binding protein